MQSWNVVSGKKSGGPYPTYVLRRSFDSGKLPIDAFVQPEDGTDDWRQASTMERFVDVPSPGEPRYCIECDSRAFVSSDSFDKPVTCPSCRCVVRFINFLDDKTPDLLSVPVEPWGPYDKLASAFASVFLVFSVIGIIAVIAAPSLFLLLGFMLFACGSALFAITFQHRSESRKYREHLRKVEFALSSRINDSASATEELTALKRKLQKVRSDLIQRTEAELDVSRREIKDELEIAKDQRNAIHRMAERFLSETQKWWTSKLSGDNYQLTKERITKAIEFCRKQGYAVSSQQQRQMMVALKHDYEMVLAREHEKAEQTRLREQIRDEQRAQREIQREIERTQKEARRRESEEETLKRALDDALRRAGAVHSAEVERLQSQLKLAEQRAIDAQMSAQRAVSQAQLTKAGNVYVISNIGSFGEDGYKVGLTRRLDPFDRVHELGDASVPFPFDVHLMIRCDDAPTLERKLHQALHRYRINRVNLRKEFFRVDLATIRKLVEKYHGKIEYEYPGSTEASEYQQSIRIPDDDPEFLARAGCLEAYEDDDDDLEGLDERWPVDDIVSLE